MRDTSHLEFDCSWTWRQQDGTLETTLSYIGFIYTFYLQIFCFKIFSVHNFKFKNRDSCSSPTRSSIIRGKKTKGGGFYLYSSVWYFHKCIFEKERQKSNIRKEKKKI